MAAVKRISSVKRATISGFPASSRWMIFSATFRSTGRCRAVYTVPMPPRPSTLTTKYRPPAISLPTSGSSLVVIGRPILNTTGSAEQKLVSVGDDPGQHHPPGGLVAGRGVQGEGADV